MLAYPLRFAPIFRRYLWGGRRLGTHLGKEIGPESDYAESWEVVDHSTAQSVVLAGPHAGRTLHELVVEQGTALLGRHAPQPRFPLLFKFLDCYRDLSLQVHPNDQQAQRLDPPSWGKTEAWVFLAAEPGSVAYAGLRPGVERAALEQSLAAGTVEQCLQPLCPQPEDCLFIPAGLVHALGKGFLVAEIQQASDITYRLFDWGRVDSTGQPRALHLEEGLAVTDFQAGVAMPQTPRSTQRAGVERLVQCDKFMLDRWRFNAPQELANDDCFHLVVVLEGEVRLPGDPLATPLTRGQTALIPADCSERRLVPQEPSVLLDIYLPD